MRDDVFAETLRAYLSGDLDRAGRLADLCHESRPESADAWHLAGIVALARRQTGRAELLIRRAIELAGVPGRPDYWTNLGNVMMAAGRLGEAGDAFRMALALDPGHLDARYNLGNALREQDDDVGARAAYGAVIAASPGHAGALTNLGALEQRRGDVPRALGLQRQAVAAAPDFVPALHNLAVAALAAGDPLAALESCDRALHLNPYDVLALAHRWIALSEAGRADDLARLCDLDRHVMAFPAGTVCDRQALPALNAALAAWILAHPSLALAPPAHATREGYHSGELIGAAEPAMAELHRLMDRAVAAYAAALDPGDPAPVARRRPAGWRLTSWSIVLKGRGHQTPHVHPDGWVSGVYYPQVADAVSTTGGDGCIIFGPGEPALHPLRRPPDRLVRPTEGMFVLFPSYAWHRTAPFACDATRISIAFDVLPAMTKEAPGGLPGASSGRGIY